MKSLVLWGCGGFAREVSLLCEQNHDHVLGFLDERPEMKGHVVDDLPVLGDIGDIVSLRDEVEIVCASVGDPALKKRLVEKTRSAGFSLAAPLIHPAVPISKRSSVGVGSIVCEGCVITVNVHIGEHVAVNLNSTIGHDTDVGDYATISPGVNVSGNVSVGEGAYLGTGSSTREKLEIGAWSVVGGGAFVKDNVPDNCLVAGVPATIKKARK